MEMTNNVVPLKGAKMAPKAVRSKMDTLMMTPAIIDRWVAPPFQRPKKVNEKVKVMAEELKQNGGVISGILTLGTIEGERTTYLIDGQHRVEAFRLSGLAECIADVRICEFEHMGEMGDEFVKLNTALVPMTTDDKLRGMEGSIAAIHNIKMALPFIGYGRNLRKGGNSPLLGMSVALRCWDGASKETPKSNNISAIDIARSISPESTQDLISCLRIVRAAWGDDPENYRLWSGLNLTMVMWLYRKLVVDKERAGGRRYMVLSQEMFKKCLLSVAADRDYADWLVGRNVGERDRSPCYTRLKHIFIQRMKTEMHTDDPKKLKMPQPHWAST
jgi:hypothetical protein